MAIEQVYAIVPNFTPESAQQCYMAMMDERAATGWVIKWLEKKENRRKAKMFEKKFFKNLVKRG